MVTISIDIGAGDNIDHAFTEAIRISKVLYCIVEFTFNGVICFARHDGDVAAGVSAYHKAIESRTHHQYARCY